MAVILVTGGAGYIGSHLCKALHAQGDLPVVYDNLSRGHREFVRWGPLEIGDIRDEARLDAVIAKHRPEACVHLAAFAYVGESVTDPLAYYHNNVSGSIALIRSLGRGGIRNLLFSSTCAVYGIPEAVPILEGAALAPINPYGHSKLAVEQIIADFAGTGQLRYGILRYFNAAGADPNGEIGGSHDPEPHLIPAVISQVMRGEPVTIFGDDYPTADGTCIRDYIHVSDLGDAHVLALRALEAGRNGFIVNLGTGQGHSVRSIIDRVVQVLGKPANAIVAARRSGDPPELVASAGRARGWLGWNPRFSDLNTIIDTAVGWHRKHQA